MCASLNGNSIIVKYPSKTTLSARAKSPSDICFKIFYAIHVTWHTASMTKLELNNTPALVYHDDKSPFHTRDLLIDGLC